MSDKTDKVWTGVVMAIFAVLAAIPFGYLIYLFVTVVFLGGGSSCPQNWCQ